MVGQQVTPTHYKVSISNWGDDTFNDKTAALNYANDWARSHPDDTITVYEIKRILRLEGTECSKI